MPEGRPRLVVALRHVNVVRTMANEAVVCEATRGRPDSNGVHPLDAFYRRARVVGWTPKRRDATPSRVQRHGSQPPRRGEGG